VGQDACFVGAGTTIATTPFQKSSILAEMGDMVIWVVVFSSEEYRIKYIFGQKSISSKNDSILLTDELSQSVKIFPYPSALEF
jgi:hypothetical protein